MTLMEAVAEIILGEAPVMSKGYYWSPHSMCFCNCLIMQADQVHFYSFPARNFYCVVLRSKKDKEKRKHEIIFPTPCNLLPPPLTALLTPCLITPPCRTHSPNLKFLLVNGFLILSFRSFTTILSYIRTFNFSFPAISLHQYFVKKKFCWLRKYIKARSRPK